MSSTDFLYLLGMAGTGRRSATQRVRTRLELRLGLRLGLLRHDSPLFRVKKVNALGSQCHLLMLGYWPFALVP